VDEKARKEANQSSSGPKSETTNKPTVPVDTKSKSSKKKKEVNKEDLKIKNFNLLSLDNSIEV